MRKFFSLGVLASFLLLGANPSYSETVEKAAEPAKADKVAEPAKADVAPPEDLQAAAQLVSVAIDLAKTGKWLALALVLIQLLVFVIKKMAPKAFMKTWGSVTVAGLSAAAAVVASVIGGASWLEALVVFASGPAMSLLIDFGNAAGILKRSDEDSAAASDDSDEETAAGEVASKEEDA